jgi:hypothetical protein
VVKYDGKLSNISDLNFFIQLKVEFERKRSKINKYLTAIEFAFHSNNDPNENPPTVTK